MNRSGRTGATTRVLAVALLASGVRAGVQVEVRLEPAEVFLGSPARLEVTIDGPPDLEVDLSALGSRLAALDGARPLARSGPADGAAGRRRAGVELRPFTLSKGPSAPTTVAVPWRAGGESGTLDVWLPLPLVREVPRRADEAEGSLRDPAGPVEVEDWAAPVFLSGLAGAALAAWLLWRRTRIPPAPRPTAPPDPPWVIAARLLDELEARGDGGDPRAFHYRLSEIVRACLVGRFGLAGLAETSQELLAECERAGVDEPVRLRAAQVFRGLDLVKFGPDSAGPGASAGSLASCRALVAGCTPGEPGGR